MESFNPFKITNEDFYTQNKGVLINQDNLIVLKNKLPDYFAFPLTVLEDCLGASFDNLGMARKKGGQVFHALGYIGIDSEGVMGMSVGSDSGSYKSTFIPITVEKNSKKIAGKNIDTYEYTINGWSLNLVSNIDGKNYIKLIVMDSPRMIVQDDGNEILENVDEENLRYEFTFSFLLEKEQSNNIQRLWSNGRFQECLRKFGSFRVYGQNNKMFTHLFENKTFPKEGVLFKVNNGLVKTTLAGSHIKITKDIVSSTWNIVEVSHPELLVTVGNSISPLGDVTSIQFTNAQNGNEGFTYLEGIGGEWKGLAYIHIVCANNRNPTHSPVSVVATHQVHIAELVKKFPGMAEAKETPTPTPPKKVAYEDLDDIAF